MAQLSAPMQPVQVFASAAPGIASSRVPENHYSKRPSFPAGLEVLVVESSAAARAQATGLLQSCTYNGERRRLLHSLSVDHAPSLLSVTETSD